MVYKAISVRIDTDNKAVSYTHLDVYKRQMYELPSRDDVGTCTVTLEAAKKLEPPRITLTDVPRQARIAASSAPKMRKKRTGGELA